MNKTFHIDTNIRPKKKTSKSVNKNSNSKKVKNKNSLYIFLLLFLILLILSIYWFKNFNEKLVKDFSDGKIIVCKDRLVSKELLYMFNKNENAFINKKDGLYFSVYYCSDFDK